MKKIAAPLKWLACALPLGLLIGGGGLVNHWGGALLLARLSPEQRQPLLELCGFLGALVGLALGLIFLERFGPKPDSEEDDKE